TEGGATVGIYSVRFYTALGTAEYVTVDTELPAGGGDYDHPSGDLWVALAEKAYAVANGLGYVRTNNLYRDSYQALDIGSPCWALSAITGVPANDYDVNPTGVANAWNAGQLIVFGTGSPSDPQVVGGHCYALVGYAPTSTTPFTVFNPWGTDSSGMA